MATSIGSLYGGGGGNSPSLAERWNGFASNPGAFLSYEASMAQLAGQQSMQQAQIAAQMAMQDQQLAAAQQQQHTGIASSMMGEGNRSMALGETATTFEKMQGLIKQGGLLSSQQIAEQARRETGQIGAGIESQEAQMAQNLAQQGIINPAALAAGTAGMKAATLGAGAKAQSQGEWQNAQSLAGILGQAGALGQSRAALQATPSYEQFETREAASEMQRLQEQLAAMRAPQRLKVNNLDSNKQLKKAWQAQLAQFNRNRSGVQGQINNRQAQIDEYRRLYSDYI